MRAVVAMDSFKGSLSSLEAGNAVKRALERAIPTARAEVCPVADGGEGTVEALYRGLGGELVSLWVTGPCFEPVEGRYCILPDGNTAVVEIASAAGLALVPMEKRDPRYTTTLGVGQLIADGIGRGCRRFVIGLGGSATNDGGVGMLSALGFEFLDGAGSAVSPTAAGLGGLASVSSNGVPEEVFQCTFRLACDVTNPLCGDLGCSAVFAPQKGASPEAVAMMDADLERYAVLAESFTGKKAGNASGAGAAGGLGFAFMCFLGATAERGIDIVINETGLEKKLSEADLVITGEGRLDGQTVMGKAPVGIARAAKRFSKPVIAFAGGVAPGAELCNDSGIDAFFPAVRGVCSLEEALDPENAEKNLEASAFQVFRLIKLFGKI